jgi:hypothetical protein
VAQFIMCDDQVRLEKAGLFTYWHLDGLGTCGCEQGNILELPCCNATEYTSVGPV